MMKIKKKYNLKKIKKILIRAHLGQYVKSLTQLWYQGDIIWKQIE